MARYILSILFLGAMVAGIVGFIVLMLMIFASEASANSHYIGADCDGLTVTFKVEGGPVTSSKAVGDVLGDPYVIPLTYREGLYVGEARGPGHVQGTFYIGPDMMQAACKTWVEPSNPGPTNGYGGSRHEMNHCIVLEKYRGWESRILNLVAQGRYGWMREGFRLRSEWRPDTLELCTRCGPTCNPDELYPG